MTSKRAPTMQKHRGPSSGKATGMLRAIGVAFVVGSFLFVLSPVAFIFLTR